MNSVSSSSAQCVYCKPYCSSQALRQRFEIVKSQPLDSESACKGFKDLHYQCFPKLNLLDMHSANRWQSVADSLSKGRMCEKLLRAEWREHASERLGEILRTHFEIYVKGISLVDTSKGKDFELIQAVVEFCIESMAGWGFPPPDWLNRPAASIYSVNHMDSLYAQKEGIAQRKNKKPAYGLALRFCIAAAVFDTAQSQKYYKSEVEKSHSSALRLSRVLGSAFTDKQAAHYLTLAAAHWGKLNPTVELGLAAGLL